MPSNPIAAHAPTVVTTARPKRDRGAPNRRVARNQTSSGQRNILSESATAIAPPATHRLSRHRQAIAARSSSTGVNVPSRTEVITGRAVTTIASTRQSRTPRSQTAPMIAAMRSRPQTPPRLRSSAPRAAPELPQPLPDTGSGTPPGSGSGRTRRLLLSTLSTFGYGETPLTTSLPPCQNWRKSKRPVGGPVHDHREPPVRDERQDDSERDDAARPFPRTPEAFGAHTPASRLGQDAHLHRIAFLDWHRKTSIVPFALDDEPGSAGHGTRS